MTDRSENNPDVVAPGFEPEPTYKIRDVAELFQVHPDTVRRWIERDELKAIKIGSTWRVPRSEVQRFGNAHYGVE